MPPRVTSKKIEVFAMHGHTGKQAINYSKLLDALDDIPKRKRIIEQGDRVIALPTLRLRSSDCYFIAVEGPLDIKPLIFNSGNAEERIEQLGDKELVVTRTHGLIDLAAREAFIEFNMRGAKASDVQELVMGLMRPMEGWNELNFSLVPLAGQEFFDALQTFSRVRLATVQMARPNIDWVDDYNDHFSAIASESDAGIFEITAHATRGGSLSKREGIIRFMREMLGRALPSLKNATITGNRVGDAAETTISLDRHVRHKRVQVKLAKDGHVVSTDMHDRLLEFAEERRRDRRAKK